MNDTPDFNLQKSENVYTNNTNSCEKRDNIDELDSENHMICEFMPKKYSYFVHKIKM